MGGDTCFGGGKIGVGLLKFRNANNRSFRQMSPVLMGLFAGCLGLVWYFWLTDPARDWFLPGQVLWPVLAASLIGLSGSAVFLINRHLSGAVLLAGGLVFLVPVALYGKYFFLATVFVVLGPDLFLGLLLILAGWLAFPKTGRAAKGLVVENGRARPALSAEPCLSYPNS